MPAVTYTVLTALFDRCDNFLWFAGYPAIFGAIYIVVFATGCGIAHIISAKDDSGRMARAIVPNRFLFIKVIKKTHKY